VFTTVLLVGCIKPKREIGAKLPVYYITNEIAGGELRQILHASNGVSLYFTESNVVVWFCPGSSIAVEYDPQSLIPMKTLLDVPHLAGKPGYEVYDSNADGVPEMRRIDGSTNTEVFYHGEWYVRHKNGTNTVIAVDGRELLLRYDSRRWVECGNTKD
jgi:hypothetical protein